jgi:hypothetical protein
MIGGACRPHKSNATLVTVVTLRRVQCRASFRPGVPMLRIIEEALTFDDVLLVPAYSEVVPSDVALGTQLNAYRTPEPADAVCGDGHGHRAPARDLDRAGRRASASSTRT